MIDGSGSPAPSTAKKSAVGSRVSKTESKTGKVHAISTKHLSKEEFKKIQEDIDKEKVRRAKLENDVRQLKDQMSTI